MGRTSAYRNIRIKIHIRIQKGADADVSSSFMMIALLNKYETIAVQTYLSEHFMEGILSRNFIFAKHVLCLSSQPVIYAVLVSPNWLGLTRVKHF